MSRHLTRSRHGDQPVLVVAGYDRPLHELFLHVIREGSEGSPRDAAEAFIYDSLDEPGKDWTDINTLTETLVRLGIKVPHSLVEQIYHDQTFNVGNRCVEHPADEMSDRPPC